MAREALKGGLGGERIDLNAKTWSISRNSRFKQSKPPILPIVHLHGILKHDNAARRASFALHRHSSECGHMS